MLTKARAATSGRVACFATVAAATLLFVFIVACFASEFVVYASAAYWALLALVGLLGVLCEIQWQRSRPRFVVGGAAGVGAFFALCAFGACLGNAVGKANKGIGLEVSAVFMLLASGVFMMLALVNGGRMLCGRRRVDTGMAQSVRHDHSSTTSTINVVVELKTVSVVVGVEGVDDDNTKQPPAENKNGALNDDSGEFPYDGEETAEQPPAAGDNNGATLCQNDGGEFSCCSCCVATLWVVFFMVVVVTASCHTIMLAAEQYRYYPGDDAFVAVDGHLMHTRCMGEGEPVVFFEHGLGGNSLDWSWIQPEVAKLTRTCSYDRAGYGRSMEPGAGRRTHKALAAETKQVLEQLNISTAIFVGHSMAGGNLRALHAAHPDLFLGIVFADMINPNATEFCSRDVEYGSPLFELGLIIAETGVLRIMNAGGLLNGFAPFGELPEEKAGEYVHGLMRAGYFRTRVAEFRYWGEGCQDTLDFTPEEKALEFPVVTVIPKEGIYKDKWEYAGQIADLSPNGTMVTLSEAKCDHSGMLFREDCAQTTLAEILKLFKQLK